MTKPSIVSSAFETVPQEKENNKHNEHQENQPVPSKDSVRAVPDIFTQHLADGAVVAHTAQGYTTALQTHTHHWQSDEPKDKGGADAGPDPFELLKSALAACTTITMRMYAERKGWPADEIYAAVDLHTTKDDAGKEVKTFHIALNVEGDLTEEQKTRLLAVSKRCPVHRTLAGDLHFATDWATAKD